MKSAAAGHIQALTEQFFGKEAFAAWNCGRYHDALHSMYVAETVASLSRGRRHQPERQMFLAQVALLHDADPRPQGTPASVPRTLEWLERQQAWLQPTLGWTELAFRSAQALIARTDFPFDDQPRRSETRFDGLSPLGLYRGLLRQLPSPDQRAGVFEDAQLLRFADQCANYCRDFPTASCSVDDLSLELSRVGPKVSREALDTASFLDRLGTDSEEDRRLAQELALPARVFSRGELFRLLPSAQRQAVARNRALFGLERKARAAG